MHKSSCYQVRARIELERHWYMTAWPNYCIECGGWSGFWSSYDPSPAGVSLGAGSIQDFETCGRCYDKELCPRCGHYLAYVSDMQHGPDQDGDYTVCTSCGWRDDQEIEGIAEHDECECWELDYDTRYL